MPNARRATSLPPPRVRREPPTLAEAFAAARDLTDDVQAEIEIAAGFMGIGLEEARAYRESAEGRRSTIVADTRPGSRPIRRTLVVERRRRFAPA